MTLLTRPYVHALAAGALALLLVLPLHAQDAALGTWHGVLDTPAGPLTVVFTIESADHGSLRGTAESPDQAPGQGVSLASVVATPERMSFSIPRWSASYEGEWVAAAAHWKGTFTQGVALPLVLERGAPPLKATVEGLDGAWEGTLDRNGVALRLVLRIRSTERGTVVNLDSPDMGAMGLPVTELSRASDRVRFAVPAAQVRFDGTLSEDGERITGDWTRPGRPDAVVTFTRTSSTAERGAWPERPQTPKEPFPYQVEDVAFDNLAAEGVSLAGTLTLPSGTGPFPAAVLISGSGPHDRDATMWGHKPFAVLADHLTRQGIAVLRYDDRGYRASTGDHAAATSADFATDALAAVRYLSGRPELDPRAIGLVGHSEGGMIAPIAASRSDRIAYVVLLAAPGTSTVQLGRSQRRLMQLSQGARDEDIARTEPVMDQLLAAVAASESEVEAKDAVRRQLTAEALRTLGLPESQKEVLVRQVAREWHRFFLRYEPSAFLAQLDVPVLAVAGSLDILVPSVENLPTIRRALRHNPDVTVTELPGLNHMFQTAETGGLGEYMDLDESFAPAALEVISKWLCARFGTPSTVR